MVFQYELIVRVKRLDAIYVNASECSNYYQISIVEPLWMSRPPRCPRSRPRYGAIRNQIDHSLQQTNKLLDELSSIKATLREVSRIRCTLQLQCQTEEVIWKHTRNYDYELVKYEDQPYLCEMPPFIKVDLRNDWIAQYLDRPGTCVKGTYKARDIKIISEQDGHVQILFLKDENGSPDTNEQSGANSSLITLKALEQHNKELTVEYTKNKLVYEMGNRIIKVCNTDLNHKMVLVLELTQGSRGGGEAIRRLLIFRKNSESSEESISHAYQFFSGFYEGYDFMVPVELPHGEYLFVPTYHESTLTNVKIYAQLQLAQILVTSVRQQVQELNLMLSAFKQCHPDKIRSQFMRTTDLKAGIVIEAYRNSCHQQIHFIDDPAHTHSRKEDKQLMFSSLYSSRLREHILRSQETLVEFHVLTRKPAVLYIPRKKMASNGREEENETKTVHSILK